jgi:hypothetical protein
MICQALLSGQVRRQIPVRGRAVQVDPIKPSLKPPEIKRLKLNDDEPLPNFGFKFNLRRCSVGRLTDGGYNGKF